MDKEDDVKDLSTDVEGKVKLIDQKPLSIVNSNNVNIKGIQESWITILKNTSLICDIIKLNNKPISSYLTDIKIFLLEDPMDFALEFRFYPSSGIEG